MYSQAGISPTIKPGIPFLPTISLTQVEYAHLMFHHIFTRACKSVKESFEHFASNEQIQNILQQIWIYCTQKCTYRPKHCSKSNLRDSSEGKLVTLKTIHTYRSAFELAVHGQVFGFDTLAM